MFSAQPGSNLVLRPPLIGGLTTLHLGWWQPTCAMLIQHPEYLWGIANEKKDIDGKHTNWPTILDYLMQGIQHGQWEVPIASFPFLGLRYHWNGFKMIAKRLKSWYIHGAVLSPYLHLCGRDIWIEAKEQSCPPPRISCACDFAAASSAQGFGHRSSAILRNLVWTDVFKSWLAPKLDSCLMLWFCTSVPYGHTHSSWSSNEPRQTRLVGKTALGFTLNVLLCPIRTCGKAPILPRVAVICLEPSEHISSRTKTL